MSIEISQMFSTMNHSQMTKKLYILNITLIFMYLMLLIQYNVLKMNGKTLGKNIKKVYSMNTRLLFIHETILKSLRYIRSQNVSYSKLKFNTFSLF